MISAPRVGGAVRTRGRNLKVSFPIRTRALLYESDPESRCRYNGGRVARDDGHATERMGRCCEGRNVDLANRSEADTARTSNYLVFCAGCVRS